MMGPRPHCTQTGDVDDALEIKSLKVVPDPPVPGKTMTIYAEGTAKQRIEVRYGFPPFTWVKRGGY